MADPPLALTYVAPALNLPPWLSYTSSPTATILAAYTVATLAADGVPTLITGAVEITRYETVLLQLAITVDSAADVRGQDLGDLYTTAGGTETETVVNEYGGTRRFTLGAGETSAAAAPTSPSATATPSRASATTSPGAPSASQGASIEPTAPPSSSDPPSAQLSPSTASRPTSSAPSATTSSKAAPEDALSSAKQAQASLSSALASATRASSLDPQAVSSLSSALASASSVSSLSATSSAATPTTNLVSSSSPSSITPSSSSPVDSTNASSSSLPSSAADASAARSGSLTGSQLAAAIAAPICFFFLVIALLLLCCCCARRRRRRRADRGLAEEHGLLGGAGAGAGGGGRHGSPSGIMWEWVPHRRPSEPNGRTSRASIRSVLSRATGGLLGGAAGRSTRSGSTPGSSPRDARERGFLASSGGNATSEERAALGPGQYGPAGEADVAEGVGPSTPLLGVESPERSSPEEPSRSPRVHYLDFNARPTVAVPFEDVDLASPRPDAAGSFGSPPREMQQTRTRPVALPLLPPIPSTNGALRLSTLYDPPVITHLPPSPSSYEPPPLGAPRRLDVSSGDLDDVSSMCDGHKRDTRLGYLSWTQGGGGESDNERAVSGYGPELTPPQTPEDEEPGLRVGGDDDDDSLDGGPMLSTRPGALRRSFSSELSETGVPDSALFLNDPRWTGARQPSPPPFSSFEPTATSSISYDPPIFIHRQAPHDVEVGLRPQSHPRHSATSGTTDSLSRYDDGSSLAPSAFPLDSPLVYPSPRFGVPHLASASAVSASRNRTVGRERSVESGLSLERIAASFGSVKDGLGSGLGFDFGGEGGGSRRSVGRNREISTESMTDPFQHPYSSFQRRLPSLPSPANTPPRHPLHSRSSQSLRRPHSQPSLIFQSIPETSPEQGAATAAAVRRYVDPYADGEESLLDADEYGGGYGDAYVGGAKRWMGVSSRVSVEE
ncbi:hypothetical protein JCM3775_001436 [Rhodotorula graminis]